jgi:hypothetical protein
METEQVVEKKSIWVKAAILLLSIAVIGQISAIYLPAFVGQSPDATSFIGTVLWTSLLFMAIWSWQGKKKLKGFLIGVIVALIIQFFAGFIAGYLGAEERAIDKAVTESNEKLPRMVDEETRMDLASIDQKSKNYSLSFTLVNLLVSEIDIGIINDNFEQSIKPSTCSIKQFQLFFSEGYTINYVYKDKSGKFISQYSIDPKECIKQ